MLTLRKRSVSAAPLLQSFAIANHVAMATETLIMQYSGCGELADKAQVLSLQCGEEDLTAACEFSRVNDV